MNSTRFRRFTHGVAALSVIGPTAVGVIHAACWEATKPTSQYGVQSSTDTVVDTATELMWKQCQEGVSTSTCASCGSNFLSWDVANTAARDSTVGATTIGDCPRFWSCNRWYPAAV